MQTHCALVDTLNGDFLTFRIFQTDSPSYPPPQRRHLAKSLPVPNGMTPTLGWCINGFLSEGCFISKTSAYSFIRFNYTVQWCQWPCTSFESADLWYGTSGAQWCGRIFILCYIHLKLALLLRKAAIVNFQLSTTVYSRRAFINLNQDF